MSDKGDQGLDEHMTEQEAEALAQLRAALKGQFRIETVVTFTHGAVFQVWVKAWGARNFRKAGPLLFPPDGGTNADTLRLLADMLELRER